MPDDGLNWDEEIEEIFKNVEEPEEGEPDVPLPPHRFSMFIIDNTTLATSRCPNGHIVEWINEPLNQRLAVIYRIGENGLTPVCAVCGEDGPGEEKPNGAQEAEPGTGSGS